MSAQYAKDQPAGFTNQLERIAIVGVSHTRTVIFGVCRSVLI